ncbi:MAG TPA: Pvc16 family protein [Polyangia bacterium]|nr:Pvc16 family protein [Polyangia bacterium]
MTAQHHIIKEAGETIGQLLQAIFKENGYKRVHLVVAAPKQEAIEGKLPAVCVYLYNISLDEEGIGSNRTGAFLDTVTGADGRPVEVERRMPLWVRLDYLVSTWAQTPEEEQLLMGGAIKGLLEHPTVAGTDLKGESFKEEQYLPISMSQKLDEGVLSRFWASLNQPMKPAIQCWTTVPIFPSGDVEIRRVQEKDVRFFDLNKLNRLKR